MSPRAQIYIYIYIHIGEHIYTGRQPLSWVQRSRLFISQSTINMSAEVDAIKGESKDDSTAHAGPFWELPHVNGESWKKVCLLLSDSIESVDQFEAVMMSLPPEKKEFDISGSSHLTH